MVKKNHYLSINIKHFIVWFLYSFLAQHTVESNSFDVSRSFHNQYFLITWYMYIYTYMYLQRLNIFLSNLNSLFFKWNFYLIQVCVKNSFSLSYVLGMIHSIIGAMDKPKDRLHYLNGLMDMFRELILDLHEFSDQGK